MSEKNVPQVALVILSFNRPEAIRRNVSELLELRTSDVEIIVVDNHSDVPVSQAIGPDAERVTVIRLNENKGVGGRNAGIECAKGEVIITLDDDVFGLTDNAISTVLERIRAEPSLGAINFRVIDDVTEAQINWCHHRKIEEWGNRRFKTYEISEGAVGFRKSALHCSGLYPEFFFISHEGPDLALRIMNCGYKVVYDPQIVVRHAHAIQGRPSWRRYYYDTRNTIWLAYRCYPLYVAVRKVPIALGALLIYSIRDGYLFYWLKAIRDAFINRGRALKTRIHIKEVVWEEYKEIEKEHPSLWYMVKNRIFQKSVGI